MVKFSTTNFDTSYWLTNDRDWVAERKVHWDRIETYFRGPASKSKKALGILSRYYLKGDIPDFESLKKWNNDERHLDPFCFLWLHPSWDAETLINPRDGYISSPFVSKEDVQHGIGLLIQYGGLVASQEDFDSIETVLNTDGYKELLFSVIVGNLDIDHYHQNETGWKLNKFTSSITSVNEVMELVNLFNFQPVSF